MKPLIYLLLITTLFSNAQNENTSLQFNTNYYDAVNKWVVFPKSDDSKSYSFGLIYIDEHAGFTYNYENNLIIKNNKVVIDSVIDNRVTNIKARLEPNTKKVAILNAEQIEALNLKTTPDWLNIYTERDNTAEYLKQMGYFYNHVGASKNAIKPLLKAYDINPTLNSLAFELGFAYNATQQFKKAIPVIKSGLKTEPKNQYLHKELGYAYLGNQNIPEAEKAYSKGIKISKDNAIKCEMAINMCNGFLFKKNKSKLKKWISIAEEKSPGTPQFTKYINYFKTELSKL